MTSKRKAAPDCNREAAPEDQQHADIIAPSHEVGNSEMVTGIAGSIAEAHRAAQAGMREAVVHAIRCGELLIAAKASMKHGDFGQLCEALPFSDRTARGYMRLARLTVGDRQRVADLSLRRALGFVADSVRRDELEAIVLHSMEREAAVGRALKEIRDQALYRVHECTFGEYCEARHGLDHREAQRLIAFANRFDRRRAREARALIEGADRGVAR